ncbi:MMPL family transporter [Micromonospora sp. 067-2]|uniref:MMPL family transporter n=1 Tax=Micromonospora sp. 067-2 TaxID=2789270 RepID=UPI00397BBC9C
MRRWTTWILRHRTLVVVGWLTIAVGGGLLAPRTVDALSYEFALPGQPAYETNQLITRVSGGGGAIDPLVLVGRTASVDEAARTAFEQQVGTVAAAVPGSRLVTPADAAYLAAADGRTLVALVYPPVVPGPEPYAAALPAIQAAAARTDVGGQPLAVTGATVLEETSGGGGRRGVLLEVVLGGLGALIVLAVVFGSLLAAVPLLVAAISILATFLCLLALTAVTDVSFVVQYLVALIGLGVAIDYSLLIVMRWREERSRGRDSTAAVEEAMATAGRSVVFSGITVAVSLAALVAVPLPFLRSIGLGGLLIPLLSVATATTLVPVLLASVGTRLQWPRRQVTDPSSPAWRRIATAAVRRPILVALASTAVLLLLAAPLLGLRLGSPRLDAYDSTTPAGTAAADITRSGLSPGVLRPLEVLVRGGDAAAAADRFAALPGVAAAVAPTGPGWSTSAGQLIQVWVTGDPTAPTGRAALTGVRDTAADIPGARVGGRPAEDADFVTAVYGNAPLVLLVIVVVTFLLLARALRSLWLPVKALLLNVLSIGAAYGITVLIWQDGVGSELLFGSAGSGALTVWVPIAVFAFLFGLSMDYEVFILARMREAYDEHGSTPRAVIDGIARTGRLVTSAALILFLAFVALSTVPAVEVKILATALALGIAIDALIVRALLAPALVVLLGDLNWSIPRGLARLLRVAPMPREPDAAPQP